MNNNRRKEIDKVIKLLKDACDEVGRIKDDEQEYLDNMPENLMGSERYENAEMAIDNLTDAENFIEDAIDALDEAKE